MAKPLSQHRQYVNPPSWDDAIKSQRFTFPEGGRTVQMRLLGDAETLMRHWVLLKGGKMFPCLCPVYNPIEEDLSLPHACWLHQDFNDYGQKSLLINAIIREYQAKDDGYGGVRIIELPMSLMSTIASITDDIGCELTDPLNAWDVKIGYNKGAKGPNKWTVVRAGKAATPLKPAEDPNHPRYTGSYVKLNDYIPNFHGIDPSLSPAEQKRSIMDAAARAAEYTASMKNDLGRSLYYVKQIKSDINPANPYDSFKGDPTGKPFYMFPALVEHEIANKSKRGALAERIIGAGMGAGAVDSKNDVQEERTVSARQHVSELDDADGDAAPRPQATSRPRIAEPTPGKPTPRRAAPPPVEEPEEEPLAEEAVEEEEAPPPARRPAPVASTKPTPGKPAARKPAPPPVEEEELPGLDGEEEEVAPPPARRASPATKPAGKPSTTPTSYLAEGDDTPEMEALDEPAPVARRTAAAAPAARKPAPKKPAADTIEDIDAMLSLDDPAPADDAQDVEPEPEPAPAPRRTAAAPAAGKKPALPQIHPDPAIPTIRDAEYGPVPNCFRAFEGAKKCFRCPKQQDCMSVSEEA